jgi:hypothetical protein
MNVQNIVRIGWVCVLFCLAATNTQGQGVSKMSAPRQPLTSNTPAPSPAPGETPAPTPPSNLTFAGGSNTQIDLVWAASTEDGGTITKYSIYRTKATATGYECDISQGIDSTSSTDYTVPDLTPGTIYRFCVVATDANDTDSAPSKILTVNTATASATGLRCWLIPVRWQCMDFGLTTQDSRAQINSNINAFYQTTGSFSFLNQIKSIYNGASGSATISADIATLNFGDGMQVNVLTNAQAGSSGTNVASSSAVPTLAANGAGQATQNIIYGGTFVVAESYPLFAAGATKWGSPGGFGTMIDFTAKEGADIQNFKSGTNVNVTSPPFHGSGQIEGYVQYNSINLAPNSQNFVGSLFAGGSYGYSYMSHGYARDYGFGNQVSNGIGVISFGVLINSSAKIVVSRAFGPSQTYTDSTTMARTTVNNFKAWSFGITYQSAPPAK